MQLREDVNKNSTAKNRKSSAINNASIRAAHSEIDTFPCTYCGIGTESRTNK